MPVSVTVFDKLPARTADGRCGSCSAIIAVDSLYSECVKLPCSICVTPEVSNSFRASFYRGDQDGCRKRAITLKIPTRVSTGQMLDCLQKGPSALAILRES